jgi:nitrous oxidase accessory protein NosD
MIKNATAYGELIIIACAALPAGTALPAGSSAAAADVRVRDVAGLRKAAAAAAPGTRILLEEGEYAGGVALDGLRGAPGKPIRIAAADPVRPPVFRGGGVALHLTDPAHVEIEGLVISGMSGNGINIDDGGSFDTPAEHITIRGVKVTDIGSRGNQDGLKLSGVTDFRIEGATIERWGTGGGSAIDMVGCHRGVIEGCTFRHEDAEGSSGVQTKGGSSAIAIRGNRFEGAGGRAVNIGGSTGAAYFRPPLPKEVAKPEGLFEAKDILVEGNTFIGGTAPVAFVGCDGATVRFNTIWKPRRWALRILQETRIPGFVPCQNGEFADNIIVFEAARWRGAVNIGADTAPATFRFARNIWYALDEPARSRPDLPAPEEGGVHGRDPLLVDPEEGDFAVREGSPARKAGAHAASAAGKKP